MICLEEFQIKEVEKELSAEYDDDVLMLGCSHKYHKVCLLQLIGNKQWAKCAICSTIFGNMIGDQSDGTMSHYVDKNTKCSGYNAGTIIIDYSMKNGIRNGKHFSGTHRTAYLPDTKEGWEVFYLLKEAFDRKLIFTVGRSVTTGQDNVVVWNGIHHKTNTSGGASHFGYPDPTYFSRVKEELAVKGVVPKK